MSLSTLTLVALCCFALIGVAVVAARKLLAHRARQQHAQSQLDDRLTRLSHVISRLESGQEAALGRLESQVDAMRADLEWLAGERMIEQASAMVRRGLPAEKISEELGLSLDAARTIALFRSH